MTHRPDSESFTTGNINDIPQGSTALLKPERKYRKTAQAGFSLVEMLLSATILLVVSMAVFSALNRIQQAASYQAEVQAVVDNTRNALQSMERCFRQAGNDPFRKGFDAISIISPTEVRIRTDLTGSRNRNKGDPDGDLNDSGENLLIRYNSGKKRLEMVSGNGPAQILAENISDLSLDFFDAEGNPTVRGGMVRKITINISGKSTYTDPRSGIRFGIQLKTTVRILT